MKAFFDRYEKLEVIGAGANAKVYKVRHLDLGYIRALKVLNERIDDPNEKVYQSFLRECRTLLKIGNGCHPNIVRIYTPDLINDHAVVEMDYIQGVTLDNYLKKNLFIVWDEVLRFVQDTVGALAYTHHDIYQFMMYPNEDNLESDPDDGQKYVVTSAKERELVKKYGVSHNDLHSNNVMRRHYDGHFVLLDFGLAVHDGEIVKSSRKGAGHPEYMSPEKFDANTVSPRSDVYSIGVLMYEILAGRVPFVLRISADGEPSHCAISDVLNQHKKATPEPILPLRRKAFEDTHPGEKYERDYPEWLDAIIMKCLAKKPEDRYADARALLDDINSKLAKESAPKQTTKAAPAPAQAPAPAPAASTEEMDELRASLSQMTAKYLLEKKAKERIADTGPAPETVKSTNWGVIAIAAIVSFIIGFLFF